MKDLTYWPGSYEYEQLRIAAEKMTEYSPHKIEYAVADIYSGTQLVTTIVDNYGMGGGRALTDDEQREAIFSTSLARFAKRYFSKHPNG